MNKKDWYRSFGAADGKFVSEAAPYKVIKPKRARLAATLIAACLCLTLLVCNLWLFIPFNTDPPDVSRYADSEYYGIIQRLNELTHEKPKYKNNAEKLMAELNDGFRYVTDGGFLKGENSLDGTAMPDAPTLESPGDGNSYEEITDNQVEGVIEADRIKRSDSHIFYLNDNVLRVYDIAGENTKEVGSYTFDADGLDITGGGSLNYYVSKWEFYLSSDCKTVTVITQYFEKDAYSQRYVKLISLDVSDPESIVKKGEFTITGSYKSSRNTNGSILLLTEFEFSKNTLDFDDETTFLPQINEGDGFRSIPSDGIVCPEELNTTRYTVVIKLNEKDLKLQGSAAFLSYTDKVYVSNEHVFLTRVFADKKKNGDGTYVRNSMTEISCLAYGGEGFERKGSVTVRGYIKDQWSMDEYEGILRVFTTTNATVVSERTYSNGSVSADVIMTATGNSNASLYCIDLSTFKTVASVIDFAPPREEIQSVRFDKEMAYVCTSIELSDPVFFFDLSDLNNITYKDTGTIEGFSTSLINLGNGYLLGIGRGGSWGSLKIEVYEETEDGVRSVCSYERENVEYSTEYKSYYVDRENRIVGLGIMDRNYGRSAYIVLHFDGYELTELVNEPLLGQPYAMRGVCIDGYMYMFGNGYLVRKIF